MRLLFMTLILLMTGCGGGGSGEGNNNHGYGWEFDAVSTNGLKLRRPGATNRDADFLEAIAQTVERCSGVDTLPPPFVISVPKESLGQAVGVYFSSPPLIVVDESWFDVAYPHEVMHYLIEVTTGNLDQTHQHPGFSNCVLTFPH